ncbi:MAG: hypothetical protein EON58_07450 [Alphaproteobacteria bacterium]|nr:MAG: hypothetical protein EON58_07450 [Alphaproteobacteria bacterium]
MTNPSDSNDLVDHAIFDQLLEMDDDDEREFSKSIVWNFFEQAETTFKQIEEALYVDTVLSPAHELTDI